MIHNTNTNNPIDFPKSNSMLKHVKGNLLDLAEQGHFHIIVHGCNCFNAMGGGIAKEIRERYPEAYEADCNYGRAGDYEKLGNYSVMLGKRYNIVNAYTQYNMSTGKDAFEYAAFELILQKLAHHWPTCNFGFPHIGMGLAKGNKERIMAMLENFAEKVSSQGGSVTLVEFKL